MRNIRMKKWTGVLLVALLAVCMILIAGAAQKSYGAVNNSKQAGYSAYIRKVNPRVSKKSADSMAGYFIQYAKKNKLNERYLMAMAQCESTFNQRAYNYCGYYGLMQTTAHLGRMFGGVSAGSLLNAKHSIRTGAGYLRYNMNAFNNNYFKAISGYVNGTGAVKSGYYRKEPARRRIAIKKNIDRFMKTHHYEVKQTVRDTLK